MEQPRNALLQRAEIELPRMLEDYPIFALGDRWSLVFCYGWSRAELDAWLRGGAG
jgi:hypothetical protein